jgi:hypothetical protein
VVSCSFSCYSDFREKEHANEQDQDTTTPLPRLTHRVESLTKRAFAAMNFAPKNMTVGLKRASQRVQAICRWHQANGSGDVEVTF